MALSRLFQAAYRFSQLGRRLDPRVVRLRDPRRYSPRILAVFFLGAALVAGAVSLAATRGEAPPESPGKPSSTYELEKPRFETGTAPAPPPAARSIRRAPGAAKKHPRFFDPFYVFSDEAIEGASAYPLLNPPGIVIDLKGLAEPEAGAEKLVGQDDRIRVVRRRATSQGLRYIIGIAQPVRRVEVICEGGVVMVFPIS